MQSEARQTDRPTDGQAGGRRLSERARWSEVHEGAVPRPLALVLLLARDETLVRWDTGIWLWEVM